MDAGSLPPFPMGRFSTLFPLSVLTSSSLEQLSELEPQGRFDARRFRIGVRRHQRRRGSDGNDSWG
jgi:hypothetical protein